MKRLLLLMLVALAAVALLAACGDDDDDDDGGGDIPDGPTIEVGAFNFDESHILAQIYAQALEAQGYPVGTGQIDPGSTREIVQPAIESGEIDFVPEYVGSLLNFLGGTATSDSDGNLEEAQGLFGAGTLLEMAPAQDTNAFVASADAAEQNGLVNVSDLADVAGELTLGGPPECPERDFCALGLAEVYGVEFGDFVPLDYGPRITALSENAIDVALLFSTDAAISSNQFVVLEDDMGLQPAENVVPAVSSEVIEAYGDDFIAFVNSISAMITTEDLQDLNARVQVDQEDAEDVARDWLVENGFLSE